MRLYRLIGLEIEALQAEYDQTMKNIASYEDILNNYDSMCEVIIEELDGIKKEYSTKRRTVIENAEEAVYEEKKDGRDRGLLPYGSLRLYAPY